MIPSLLAAGASELIQHVPRGQQAFQGLRKYFLFLRAFFVYSIRTRMMYVEVIIVAEAQQ